MARWWPLSMTEQESADHSGALLSQARSACIRDGTNMRP
jgi:hypothetical protein